MQEINGSKTHRLMADTPLSSLTHGAVSQPTVKNSPSSIRRIFIDLPTGRIALWPGESTTIYGDADRVTLSAERQGDLADVEYIREADPEPLPKAE
ncbi:MAG: hypothetical protein K2X03_21170 [Bryobacteraceae bacterium]|nr:hypothetical protein [Bryobacteraceae bacterium]